MNSGKVIEVLRGQVDAFETFAHEIGYSQRVLQEDSRQQVRRVRLAEWSDECLLGSQHVRYAWAHAALHDLPSGLYRIQLISPQHLTVASVTVRWTADERKEEP